MTSAGSVGLAVFAIVTDLISLTAVLAVVHYWWLVKADLRRPEMYAAIVAVLLGFRMWWAWRTKVPAAPARARASTTPAA